MSREGAQDALPGGAEARLHEMYAEMRRRAAVEAGLNGRYGRQTTNVTLPNQRIPTPHAAAAAAAPAADGVVHCTAAPPSFEDILALYRLCGGSKAEVVRLIFLPNFALHALREAEHMKKNEHVFK